jgi:hypothetical protein
MIFLCEDAQRAHAFRAVVKNRFGLAAMIFDEAKVHVSGDDTDTCDITRQVKELAHWLNARLISSLTL